MEYIEQKAPRNHCSPAAIKVLEYCDRHNLAEMDNGQHLIDGDDFYVNIFSYNTNLAEERIWEAHRKFIDVHIVLEGSELVCQNFVDDCETGEYHEDIDYLEISPTANTRFTMRPGYLTVFYPQDAHQTGVRTPEQASQTVRKAVFKVRI